MMRWVSWLGGGRGDSSVGCWGLWVRCWVVVASRLARCHSECACGVAGDNLGGRMVPASIGYRANGSCGERCQHLSSLAWVRMSVARCGVDWGRDRCLGG
jgi:hypothetical protein